MDINYLRGIITGVLLLSFIGLWIWAWSSRRKADFEAAAALPLEEDREMNLSDEESRK